VHIARSPAKDEQIVKNKRGGFIKDLKLKKKGRIKEKAKIYLYKYIISLVLGYIIYK
jgi:hypothetical protein